MGVGEDSKNFPYTLTVMASSLSAILAYERFHRDALLLDGGDGEGGGRGPVSARCWAQDGRYTYRTGKAKELYHKGVPA